MSFRLKYSILFLIVILGFISCQADKDDLALSENTFERLFYVSGDLITDLNAIPDTTSFDYVVGNPDNPNEFIASSANAYANNIGSIYASIGTTDIEGIQLDDSALIGITIKINELEGQIENSNDFRWTKNELERLLQVREYEYGNEHGQVEISFNRNQPNGYITDEQSNSLNQSSFEILSIQDYEYTTDNIDIKGKLVQLRFNTIFIPTDSTTTSTIEMITRLENVEGVFLFRYEN